MVGGRVVCAQVCHTGQKFMSLVTSPPPKITFKPAPPPLQPASEGGGGSCAHTSAEMCSGSEAVSYLRRIDSCIPQLKAKGPCRTCNESQERAEEVHGCEPGLTDRNSCLNQKLTEIKVD